MNEMFTDTLAAGAAELGIELSGEQLALCALFADLVRTANTRINLTAITAPADMAVKHFLDSMTCILTGIWPKGARCADVGTGAGFPGVPLAILRPDTRWVLLDSLGKRVDFLRQAAAEAGLAGVECRQMRAEEAGADKSLRETFDVVVARAVARLPVLAEYCLPLVAPGGVFIAMKGPDVGAEVAEAMRAIRELGGSAPEIKEISLPADAGERSLVCIGKERRTPRQYPRKPGVPAKKPV